MTVRCKNRTVRYILWKFVLKYGEPDGMVKIQKTQVVKEMSTKLSLLGISFILFGIACLATGIGHIPPNFVFNMGLIMPVIGLILSIIGFFTKSKDK